MSLKTVARYSFPYEAQIAWAKLDSAGIPAFIADQHTINAQWLYSDALGGVRLQVPASLLAEAHSVLTGDQTEALEADQGYDFVECSSCGSRNTEFVKADKRIAYLMFLLIDFPLFPTKHTFRCRDCGHIEIT